MMLAIVGLAVLALVVTWHFRLRRAIAPHRGSSVTVPRHPSVTMIRPVRGADVGAEDNFRAALDTGYPGEVETLFVFDDDSDPGLPIARRVVVAHHQASGRPGPPTSWSPARPRRDAPASSTPWSSASARHGRADRLRRLRHAPRSRRAPRRRRHAVGVAAERLGVRAGPRRRADAGRRRRALRAHAERALLAAGRVASGEKRELPFIMGQLMVFRREALAAIGGVESVQGQLVDDMAIGKRVHEAGYQERDEPLAAAHRHRRPDARQFLPVFRRWMMLLAQRSADLVRVAPVAAGRRLLRRAVARSWPRCGSPRSWRCPAAALAALTASCRAQPSLRRRPIPARLVWTAGAFFLISPVVLVQNMLKKRSSGAAASTS